MDQTAYDAIGELVENPVQHPGLVVLEGFNQVLVVPELVRPESLFIDKMNPLPNMFDLGQPPAPAKQGNPYFVEDHQPVVHLPGDLGQDSIVQPGRSQLIEIDRSRQKFPGFFRIGIEDYFPFDGVHGRGSTGRRE